MKGWFDAGIMKGWFDASIMKVWFDASNDPNAHITTYCKRWSFIWRCFSLRVSLGELKTQMHYASVYLKQWIPNS